MKRYDPIGKLIVSLILIASGAWALIDAVLTGRMHVPRSGDDTVSAFTVEFGFYALLYMLAIATGVVGVIGYVVRDLGRGREP